MKFSIEKRTNMDSSNREKKIIYNVALIITQGFLRWYYCSLVLFIIFHDGKNMQDILNKINFIHFFNGWLYETNVGNKL